jgi:hypothetical protein
MGNALKNLKITLSNGTCLTISSSFYRKKKNPEKENKLPKLPLVLILN